MSLERPRRYYLQKSAAARARGEMGLADAWRTKQLAEPGVVLPDAWPHANGLRAAGYTAREDLDGADEDELRAAGLGPQEARAVLAALHTFS